MTTYTIRYCHDDNCTPGTLEIEAASDAAAVEALRKFVRDGFRNQTWAMVDLGDGQIYGAHNSHGEVKGGYR
jgi:hypothetical protein